MNKESFVQAQPVANISVGIVPGASNPNNGIWYEPQIVQIGIGKTVNWTNNDTSLHTVTSGSFFSGPSPYFDSGIMNPGDQYSVKFNSTLTYTYYCTLHPFMFGSIDVK